MSEKIYDSNDICDRLCVAVGYGDGPIGLVNPDGPRAAGEILRLRAEIERLRLTASERVAVKWAAEMLEAGSLPRTLHQDSAAILRGLLARSATSTT